MKTTNLMIVGGALLMMISCDNTARDNERNEAKDNLKSFVDSVDRVADERTDHNWTELDNRYNTLEQRAETAYMNAEDQDLEDLREIQAKYEEAKIEGMKKEVEMTQTSEMHIQRVESWRESRTVAGNANTNSSDDMEGTVKESVDWLEDNFDNLKNDTRSRYERIRADVGGNDNNRTTPGGTTPGGGIPGRTTNPN